MNDPARSLSAPPYTLTPLAPSYLNARTHIPTMSTSPHISPLHHPNQKATVVPPQAPLGSNGGQSANSPLPLPLPWPTSSLPPSPALLCSYCIPGQSCNVLGSDWHPPAALASTRIIQHPLPAPTSSLNMTADPTTSPLCAPPQPTTSPSTLPQPSRWVPRLGLDRRRCYRRGWRPSECVSALTSRCGGLDGSQRWTKVHTCLQLDDTLSSGHQKQRRKRRCHWVEWSCTLFVGFDDPACSPDSPSSTL